MADVQQEYTSMLEIGNAAAELQNQFDQLRQNLDSTLNSLDGNWIGNTQIEVAIAYRKLAPKLDKVSKALGAYTNAITRTVQAEKSTEHASSTQFRSIDSVYGI